MLGFSIPRKAVIALNERQRRFAEYFHECGNIVQSAIQAGYSENYAKHRAHELLENVGVAEYLRKLASAARNDRILTAVKRQELLSQLAMDTEVEPKDRIRAVDVLNKMTGEYTVKVEAAVETSGKLDDIMSQIGGDGLHE